MLRELATGDFVGLERELQRCGLDDATHEPAAARRAACAAARRCSTTLGDAIGDAAAACAPSTSALAPEVARAASSSTSASSATSATTRARCSRSTTPALGAPLGGGGRYDDLLGRFGRSLPAVGFALRIDDLHLALTASNGAHER